MNRTLEELLEEEPQEDLSVNIKSISIGLASPAVIRSWSHGVVKEPETINYRTFKPQRDGLFCERIFGPIRNYQCACKARKGIRYKGVICEKCGVEVTRSDVRRRRMGHIELAVPVAHIWYVRKIPSPIALLLNISMRNLEKVIYYESYIVIDSGPAPVEKFAILSESEYLDYKYKYGEAFKADSGAPAIKECLKSLDLKKLAAELRQQMKIQPKSNLIRQVEVVEALLHSPNKPEWMILDVLPVLPPELRPMVQLDGGRFASSDLNDLYRRVINRNQRLERLLKLNAPEIIVRNEKRLLQEAVDALFDNLRRRNPIRSSTKRPLKSLSDILRGKQGRFRQNLLGKRVDYSGRAVIVVDPTLKLHECGLPRRMALELFKPFIIKELLDSGLATVIRKARMMIEDGNEIVMDILSKVVKDHIILLNRAPTLHRMGIQAFVPILTDDNAIKIHPLVCTAYNADFDGDQMAVHVPLMIENQLEARFLMLSTNNVLSPANGRPLVTPTQDMVVGMRYLTSIKKNAKGTGAYFATLDEARAAYEFGEIQLHAKVYIHTKGQLRHTTLGRALFNECLPEDFPYIEERINKGHLSRLILDVYERYGRFEVIKMLDKLKEMGMHYATISGITFSMHDIKVPQQKNQIIKEAFKEVEEIYKHYQMGVITEEERYNKIVDLWTQKVELMTRLLMKQLQEDQEGFNPIYLMVDSGARGTVVQVRQLGALRGQMAKPTGEIIEMPVTANFKEGLNVLQYFISTHGARKGLADTALKTADCGYLTRRLIDVAQDVFICEQDCKTLNGMVIEAIREGEEIIEPLSERILGRVALDDIINPMTGEVIVSANCEIDKKAVETIEREEIERVRIRSVLTCESKRGICRKCYGWDMSKHRLVDLGEAVGIIAAQSIGEPGTQLTMRTFHIGGTASRVVKEHVLKFPYPVEIIRLPNRLIQLPDGTYIAYRHGTLTLRRIFQKYPKTSDFKPHHIFDGLWVNAGEHIANIYTKEGEVEKVYAEVSGIIRELEHAYMLVSAERNIPIRVGTKIMVKECELVEADKIICESDPYNDPILSEISGMVKYVDIVKDTTVREELDENTGLYKRVVVEDKQGYLQPRILIERPNLPPITYVIPNRAQLIVNDGQWVNAGDILAKFPQQLIRTKDITGGLPHVVELFEARRPKNPAVVAEIDGIVKLSQVGGKRRITIFNEKTQQERVYEISFGRHLRVHDGDEVLAGEALTDGSIDPHDILRIKGEKQLQMYLLREIQEIYQLQGVKINDKHIEVIIRQMLRRVEITDVGDTDFLVGQLVDKFIFQEVNEQVVKRGGRPAQARVMLLGITKAALSTYSFISAASFQETTRVLSDAAIRGKRDEIFGLKENVMLGKPIPVGTGLEKYKRIKVEPKIIDVDKLREDVYCQPVSSQTA